MKDIDFDELDRAVNSLMKPKTDSEIAGAPSAETSELINKDKTTPSEANQSTPPQPISRTTNSARPLPRTSGRFMDVMSSSAKTRPAANSPVRREGTSIEPATTQQVASKPLEVKPNTDIAQSNTPYVAEPTKQDAAFSESASSPFIANAKVEKRPLGNIAQAQQSTAVASKDNADETKDSDQSNQTKPDKQVLVAPKDAPSQPPPELNKELVDIESNEQANRTNAADSSHISNTNHSATFGTPKPTISASIEPQYTEKGNSGDLSHAAIYDTSSYTQPLAHPAKRKTGWMWVVWIVLLLAVGSGSAIALYYLGVL